VLDGEVISSPQVNEGVQCNFGIQGGRTDITGDFTQARRDELAVLIKGGALPVPVTIIASSTVGPTLGQDAIDASVRAGDRRPDAHRDLPRRRLPLRRLPGRRGARVVRAHLVRRAGRPRRDAHPCPGSVVCCCPAGLAIDANVLVFERAREEYAASRSKRLCRPRQRLRQGLQRDRRLQRHDAAGRRSAVLPGLRTGARLRCHPRHGVLASIVSALLVTGCSPSSASARLVSRRPCVTGLSTLGRFRNWLEAKKPDLMQHSKKYLIATRCAAARASPACSCAASTSASSSPAGRVVEFTTTQELSVADARGRRGRRLPDRGRAGVHGENITVRTSNLDDDDVETSGPLRGREVGGEVPVNADDIIGPTLGTSCGRRRIIALVIALCAAGLPRHPLPVDLRAAPCWAMLHDVVIVIGIFAWLGKPDRRRLPGRGADDHRCVGQRLRRDDGPHPRDVVQPPHPPLRAVVQRGDHRDGAAHDQHRLGAFFILGALTFLGGRSLTDFALALLIGLFVGTYSSAFVASPLMMLFEQKNSAPPPMPKRKTSSSSARRAPARSAGPRPAARASRGRRAGVAQDRAGGRGVESFNTILLASSALLLVAVVSVRLATAPGCRRCSSTWRRPGVGEAGSGVQFSDYEITAELGCSRSPDPGRGRADDPLVGGAAGAALRVVLATWASPSASRSSAAWPTRARRRRAHGRHPRQHRRLDRRGRGVLRAAQAAAPARLRSASRRSRAQRRPVVVLVVLASSDAWGDDDRAAGVGLVALELIGGAAARAGCSAGSGASCWAGSRCRRPASTRSRRSRCACWRSPPGRRCTSAASSPSTWPRWCSATARCRTAGRLGFAGSTALLAEAGLFVLLGLLASPARLLPALPEALLIGAAATCWARPLAVARVGAAVPPAVARAGVPVLGGAARGGADRHRDDPGHEGWRARSGSSTWSSCW
jgi:SecD/SecF fusion protein